METTPPPPPAKTLPAPLKVALVLLGAFAAVTAAAVAGYQLLYLETISGKVLIVQQNAHANKMALIEVVAISREDAHAWRDGIARDCYWILEEKRKEQEAGDERIRIAKASADQRALEQEGHIARLQQLLFLARKGWETEGASAGEHKRRFFILIGEARRPELAAIESQAMASNWQDAYMALKHDLIPEAQRQLTEMRAKSERDIGEIIAEMSRAADAHDRKLERTVSMDNLSRIPQTVRIAAVDRTDDTGEFRLRLPRGDYYVIASGERDVFSRTENYHWAQPVSVPSRTSEKCLLGNMNLVEATDDDLWQQLRHQVGNMRVAK